jgi:simple sugar transport system permease protein
MIGLPVDRLMLLTCVLGGAAAGLAGMFEVAAVQGSANDALIAGYGTGGILVAFAARQHPLGIILCATLIGGIEASGSLLQRRLDLPDATTLILEGLLFTNLLAWEALNGRITGGVSHWRHRAQRKRRASAWLICISPPFYWRCWPARCVSVRLFCLLAWESA